MKRRRGVKLMVSVVALLAIGAIAIALYYNVWGSEASTVQERSEPYSTSFVDHGDITQSLSFKGSITEQNIAESRVYDQVIEVKLPSDSLFALMPKWLEGKVESTFKLVGRSKKVTCESTKMLGVLASEHHLVQQSEVENSNEEPVKSNGDQSDGPRLVCFLPEDTTVYLTESGEVTLNFQSDGKTQSLKLAGVVETRPRSTELVRKQMAVAAIDPATLHVALPSLEKGTATGRLVLVNEGRTIGCASVAPETIQNAGAVTTNVMCEIPVGERVYSGVEITLVLTLASVENVPMIQATAIRAVSNGQGVVSIVSAGPNGDVVLTDRTIQLGISNGPMYEVKDGLELDDELLDPASQQ